MSKTRTVSTLYELIETMGAWQSIDKIKYGKSGEIRSVTLVWPCHSSAYGRYLEYEKVKIRPLVIAEQCGAPAEGGPCILPAGHNMGQADVPSQHHWEAIAVVATAYHDQIVGEAQRQIHALEDQLQAARATIAEHQAYLDSMMDGENDFTDASFHLRERLSADTSIHDAAIKAARVKELREFATRVRAELAASAEGGIDLGDDYLHGMRSVLMQVDERADSIERTEADRG